MKSRAGVLTLAGEGCALERERRPTLAEMGRVSGHLLLIVAVIAVASWAVSKLPMLFIAVFVAILLAALLSPLVNALARHKWPRTLAAFTSVVVSVAALVGVIAWIIPQAVSQVRAHGGELTQRADQLIHRVTQMLPVQEAGLQQMVQRVGQAVRENAQSLAGTVLTGAAAVATVVTGLLLAVVLTFFFVRDGRRMVEKSVGLLPPAPRRVVLPSLFAAWETLGKWIRGAVIVALIDAAGVGIGLFVLGVPLALPLIVLTFLGAFIPVVGATVAGAAAVLVALATGGTTDALIILAVVVAVQQLEGNVLEPFVLGRFVPLHPAVILIAVAVGALIAGIAGAFVAVPLAAATAAAISELSGIGEQVADPEDRSESDHPDEPQPDARH